jgi:hypothetical protein
MKKLQILRITIISVAFILLLIGCSGMNLSELIGSIINCIFYGECDFDYDSYYYTTFEPVGENDGIALLGKWRHSSPQLDDYYELTFYLDRHLEIVMYRQGVPEPVRSDRGMYLSTDEKLTISMDNGTQSVVDYILDDKILYLSLPLME